MERRTQASPTLGAVVVQKAGSPRRRDIANARQKATPRFGRRTSVRHQGDKAETASDPRATKRRHIKSRRLLGKRGQRDRKNYGAENRRRFNSHPNRKASASDILGGTGRVIFTSHPGHACSKIASVSCWRDMYSCPILYERTGRARKRYRPKCTHSRWT